MNFGTIFTIYILAFLAVYNREILFAKVPSSSRVEHVTGSWEAGIIVGVNLALALFEWINVRKYTDTLLAERGPLPPGEVTAASY